MTRPEPEFYCVGAVATEEALSVRDFDIFTHASGEQWHNAIQESQHTGTLN